jgi:hypothetical protein
MKSSKKTIKGMIKYSRNINEIFHIAKQNNLIIENQTARYGRIMIKEKDNYELVAMVYFDPMGRIKSIC